MEPEPHLGRCRDAKRLSSTHSKPPRVPWCAQVPKRAGAALQSPEGAAAALLSKQLVRIETALDLPPLQVLLEELRCNMSRVVGVGLGAKHCMLGLFP